MVDDAEEMALVISDEDTVNLMSLHDSLYLCYLRRRENHLRVSRHDIADGMVEELLLPAFHSPAYVPICYEPLDTAVLVERHSHAELTFADMYDSIAKMHRRGYDGQILMEHDILGCCQQTSSQ